MIRAIKFKNYKNFKEEQRINLRPITFIVGPNGGGKTSIINLIKLLNDNLDSNDGVFDIKDFKSISHNFSRNPINIVTTFEKYSFEEGLPILYHNSYDGISLKMLDKNKNKNTPLEALAIDFTYQRALRKTEIEDSYLNKIIKKDFKLSKNSKEFGVFTFIKNGQIRITNSIKKELVSKIYNIDNGKLKEILSVFYNNQSTKECKEKLSELFNMMIPQGILEIDNFFNSKEIKLKKFQVSQYNNDVHAFSDGFIGQKIITHKDLVDFLNIDIKYDDFSNSNIGIINPGKEDDHLGSIVDFVDDGDGFFDTVYKEKEMIFPKISKDKDIHDNISILLKADLDENYKNLLELYVWRYIRNHMQDLIKKEIIIPINNLLKDINHTKSSSFGRSINFVHPLRSMPKDIYTLEELLEHLFDNCSKEIISQIMGWASGNLRDWTFIKWFEEYLQPEINRCLDILGFDHHLEIKQVESNQLDSIYYTIHFKNTNSKKVVYKKFSDMAFGYSQILPIISVFCVSKALLNRNMKFLTVIEQPELHLHPNAQAQIAHLMQYVIDNTGTVVSGAGSGNQLKNKNASIDHYIISETHSEYSIRETLVLIADGKIHHSNVTVLYVDKDKKTGYSQVRNIEIDERGFFKEKWPEGFFDISSKSAEKLWESRKKK